MSNLDYRKYILPKYTLENPFDAKELAEKEINWRINAGIDEVNAQWHIMPKLVQKRKITDETQTSVNTDKPLSKLSKNSKPKHEKIDLNNFGAIMRAFSNLDYDTETYDFSKAMDSIKKFQSKYYNF